jgi:hypothetical protein
MEEIAGNADVAALCESGWVTPEAVAAIEVVRERPKSGGGAGIVGHEAAA